MSQKVTLRQKAGKQHAVPMSVGSGLGEPVRLVLVRRSVQLIAERSRMRS
jgi:hypothetical protein